MREILEHAGKISHNLAKEHAEYEYNIFNEDRIKFSNESDFDLEETIKNINKKDKKK